MILLINSCVVFTEAVFAQYQNMPFRGYDDDVDDDDDDDDDDLAKEGKGWQ